MDTGSLLGSILGTILNDKRDTYVSCLESLHEAKIDSSSRGLFRVWGFGLRLELYRCYSG